MSTQSNKSQTNELDINELVKKNFELYFQEVEKEMPQYFQSFTKLQEDFMSTWKKTVNSSIKYQQEYAKKANIETNIPQEYANIIQSIVEECVKAKNIQNQTVLSTLKVTGNNLQNQDNSFELVAEFNKKFLDFWANYYSKNK